MDNDIKHIQCHKVTTVRIRLKKKKKKTSQLAGALSRKRCSTSSRPVWSVCGAVALPHRNTNNREEDRKLPRSIQTPSSGLNVDGSRVSANMTVDNDLTGEI